MLPQIILGGQTDTTPRVQAQKAAEDPITASAMPVFTAAAQEQEPAQEQLGPQPHAATAGAGQGESSDRHTGSQNAAAALSQPGTGISEQFQAFVLQNLLQSKSAP